MDSVGSNGKPAEIPLIKQAHGGALRRLPKGMSGNPSGISKKRLITRSYEKHLKGRIPDNVAETFARRGFKIKTGADAVAVGQLLAAAKGEAPSAKEMREATEGRAALRLEGELELGMNVMVRRVE